MALQKYKPTPYRPTPEINLLFKWAKYYTKFIPELELLFNIPRGVKAGVPNVFWPVKTNKYSGIFILLLTNNKDVRYSQNNWINGLVAQGFKVVIASDHLEAKKELKDYYERN